MQNFYLGIKQVQAEPCSLGDYNKFKGWNIPDNEDPNRPGYQVQYVDDQDPQHVTWTPKEIFEKYYFHLTSEDGSKIEKEDVLRLFKPVKWETLPDKKTTLVKGNTLTGFVQYGTSSCVDPKNYDIDQGRAICCETMINRIWNNLGFVLQWARNGLSNDRLEYEND